MRLRRPRGWPEWSAVAFAVLVVAPVLFVWTAPYNIAASVPHLPGVSWLLNTYMRNSVKTWSMGTEPPEWVDLGDPALVRLGASHFEGGCAPCHGAPGRLPNPLVEGMRPAPPPLDARVTRYDAAELWWLVRNGIKYTAMPEWSGAHRDDEPWALAAFMLRYPDLDPRAYAELAYGPVAPGATLAAPRTVSFGGLSDRLERLRDNCARCHGDDGLGRDGTAPKLAGQSEPYLKATLLAYAGDHRQSGIMEPLAAALSPEELAGLAAHYAERPAFGAEPFDPADAALYALGADLAGRGTKAVPSCLSCHGEGMTPPRKPLYPRISGQTRRWLVTWLRLWRERDIGGTDHSHLMQAAANPLSDGQIEALAVYFAAGGGAPDSARITRP